MPELPKSIKFPHQLLQQSRGTLKAIFKQSQALLSIQAIVKEIIPGDIQVASFHNGALHLTTPSAALATRIKYSQKALIASLKQRKNPFIIENLKVSVRPQIRPANNVLRLNATPPSIENARHITTAAQYIEDDALRTALMRLSTRAKPPNSK